MAERHAQRRHEDSGCTDYLQHNWQSCPENQPQGNEAQHSPLPDRSTRKQWSGIAQEAIQDSLYWKRKHQETKAHADKLAEELKRLSMRVLQSDFYQHAKNETDDALSTLKAYEAAQ